MQGQDAGGLYRESLDVLSQELMSPILPLFIKSPNGRENMGDNRFGAASGCLHLCSTSSHREKFVPNPTAVRPWHVNMYHFLGELTPCALGRAPG